VPPPKPDVKPVPWRWIAVGTLVGGVVFLTVGAGVTSMDGSCATAGTQTMCKKVYSTAAGGGVMIAVGLAALGTSAGMWYMDWKSRGSPRKAAWAPTLAPLSNGAMVGAVGRF
jgi:hypothetical protein